MIFDFPFRPTLIRGLTLNERQLAECGLQEARETLDLLARTLQNRVLADSTRQVALELITGYAKTWRLLLDVPPGTRPAASAFNYDCVVGAITGFKRDLMTRGEASPLFGNPRDEALQSILGNIEQTMYGKPLYRSREEKAAHLLYLGLIYDSIGNP